MKRKLLQCFNNCFLFSTQNHNYSIRIAQDYNPAHNLQIRKTMTQRSIRSQGVKTWNNLLPLIKNNIDLSSS